MTGIRSECRKVELDFFESAPVRIVNDVELPCSAETLFRHFEDAASWPVWVNVIENVEYTSPMPIGPGSTRSVEMTGGLVADEEFLAWDAPHHLAFRFNQFTQGFLKAFAEDYRVTDLGNDRCRLVWTVGLDPAGPPALSRLLLKPFLAMPLKMIAKDLRAYVESHNE